MYINQQGNDLTRDRRFPLLQDPLFYIIIYLIPNLYPFIRVPLVWSFLTIGCFMLLTLRDPKFRGIISSPVLFWAALGGFMGILAFSYFSDHGYRLSHTNIAYRVLRYVPEIIMGMYVANRRSGIYILCGVILLVGGATSFASSVFSLHFYGETGQTAIRHAHRMGNLGVETSGAFDVLGITNVHGAAARAYIFILSLGFIFTIIGSTKVWLNFVFVGAALALLVGAAFSGLTTPMILLVIGVAALLLTRIHRLKTWGIGILSVALFSVATWLSYTFHIGVFTKYTDKAYSLLGAIFGFGDTIFEDVDRFQLFMVSWNSFIENPIFGVGGYIYIPGLGASPIGGHSSFADMLGQYGIIGGSVLAAMLFTVIFYLLRIRRGRRHQQLGPFYLTLLIYFGLSLIHSLVNPVIGAWQVQQMLSLVIGITFGLSVNRVPGVALSPPPRFKSMPTRVRRPY